MCIPRKSLYCYRVNNGDSTGIMKFLELRSSSLLLVDLNDIVLFHFQGFGSFVIINSATIKQKPEGGNWDSDSFSIGLLQLSHLSCLFDTKMDFVAVLSNNLQLDVFGIFAHFLWFLNANSSEVMSDQDGVLKESPHVLCVD